MSPGFRIVKGGKLIQSDWVYNEETKEGKYEDFDRTATAIRHLFDDCTLEEGVTLKDIFLLLNTELEIFDTVLSNWCKEIVTEGLTQPPEPYDLTIYDPEQIEYLELYFTPSYELYEGVDSCEGFNRPDFHGIGVILKNDGDQDHYKKGERIAWGVSFTPSNELINIPIKLGDTFDVHEGTLRAKDHKYEKLISFKNPSYTLGMILYGIIWELSFHGGPSSRNDMSAELLSIVSEFNAKENEEE